ncbi:MAG: hypothetical protein IPJ61_19825 [Tessaracoccus sp.]|uniref:hypothetical protein n=1 Tax=Tessaracoccus sp. TaxID=1971211 RepID=UPI001EBC68E6|nr:hypothetical protein [Tessaracoccus sp.]MBK7823236.1 hypothetical protein [Tessaracoccus sp.]
MLNLDAPFLFQFSDIVAGNGFFAHVEGGGRGLMRRLPDATRVWVVGVRPGLIGGRADQAAAFHAFRAYYQRTIFDIAAGAATFDTFKSRVDEFLQYIDDADTSRWGDALAQTLRTSVPPGLARVVDGTPPSIRTVTLIDKPEPRFNKLSEIAWATPVDLP